jgi:hypothetical protein
MSNVRTINFGIDSASKARSISYFNKVKKNPKIGFCIRTLDLQLHGYVVMYAYR